MAKRATTPRAASGAARWVRSRATPRATGAPPAWRMSGAPSVDGVLINRHGGSPPPFPDSIRRLRILAIVLNSKQEAGCLYPDDLHRGMLLEKIASPQQAPPARAIPDVLLGGATCMPARSHP
jgi:hypothetical protein